MAGIVAVSSFADDPTSYTDPFCGVASPGVGTPFSCLSCFLGLSSADTGLVLRFGRNSPLADMAMEKFLKAAVCDGRLGLEDWMDGREGWFEMRDKYLEVVDGLSEIYAPGEGDV